MKLNDIIYSYKDDKTAEVFTFWDRYHNNIQAVCYKGIDAFFNEDSQHLILKWNNSEQYLYEGICETREFFILLMQGIYGNGYFEPNYKGKCEKCKKEFPLDELSYSDNVAQYVGVEDLKDLEEHECFCDDCFVLTNFQ